MTYLSIAPTAPTLAGSAVVATVVCTLILTLRAVYRLYFHPLSSFPGLKFAAISGNWEKYQTLYGYPEHIFENLHQKYKTKVLRVGPNDLHISDVKIHKQIYNQVKAYPKDPEWYDSFDLPHTSFAETDPLLAKERRKLTREYFSKTSIAGLEPVMLHELAEIGKKLDIISGDSSFDILTLFRCFITDIITEFCFGGSVNLVNESAKSFQAKFQDSFDDGAQMQFHLYHSGFLRLVKMYGPKWLMHVFIPGSKGDHEIRQIAQTSIDGYKARKATPQHPVIYEKLSSSLFQRDAFMESFMLVGAGSDTTAYASTTAVHYVLQNPSVEEKLVKNLDEAIGELDRPVTLVDLERIDYLRAVIKEGLRMGMPVTGRLRRIVPSGVEPLIVDGKVIPPGTKVGISAYSMHMSEEIWGNDAREFNPNRWMGDDNGKSLDPYLVTFGKGARSCLGINLAYSEMYFILYYLFSNFRMTLLTRKMEATDYFIQKLHEPGVQVKFERRT